MRGPPGKAPAPVSREQEYPRVGLEVFGDSGPQFAKSRAKKNPLLADILTSLLVHADLASTGNPFQPIIAKWLFVFNSNFLRVKETVLSR